VAAPRGVVSDSIGQRQEVQGHLVDIEMLVIKRRCLSPAGNGNVYEREIASFVNGLTTRARGRVTDELGETSQPVEPHRTQAVSAPTVCRFAGLPRREL
jgi:hypothetical protein